MWRKSKIGDIQLMREQVKTNDSMGEGQSHFFCQWVVCLQCMFGDWLPSMVEFGRGLLTSFDQLWLVPMLNCWISNTCLPGGMGGPPGISDLSRFHVPLAPKERWKKAVGFGWFPTTWLCDTEDLPFNDESTSRHKVVVVHVRWAWLSPHVIIILPPFVFLGKQCQLNCVLPKGGSMNSTVGPWIQGSCATLIGKGCNPEN